MHWSLISSYHIPFLECDLDDYRVLNPAPLYLLYASQISCWYFIVFIVIIVIIAKVVYRVNEGCLPLGTKVGLHIFNGSLDLREWAHTNWLQLQSRHVMLRQEMELSWMWQRTQLRQQQAGKKTLIFMMGVIEGHTNLHVHADGGLCSSHIYLWNLSYLG